MTDNEKLRNSIQPLKNLDLEKPEKNAPEAPDNEERRGSQTYEVFRKNPQSNVQGIKQPWK